MSHATNWLENALGEWMLRSAAAPTPPVGGFYMALHDADPTEAGNVGELVTATDINYVRVQIPPADWAAGVNGRFETDTQVLFPAAGSNWGLIVGVSFWDDPTAGNPWFQYPLSVAQQRTVNTGEVFRASASNLAITVL